MEKEKVVVFDLFTEVWYLWSCKFVYPLNVNWWNNCTELLPKLKNRHLEFLRSILAIYFVKHSKNLIKKLRN